ncbi:AAA family ATPase [Thermoplasma acidophilum]|nr:DEAD/DEAH box helicase [Thermoplasma acidophilum]
MKVNLSDEIKKIENQPLSGKNNIELDSWKKAINVISKNMDNGRIGIVQGPPGTGKTTIYANAFSRYFDKLGDGNIIVYIAPTNELVYDMFKKVGSEYAKRGAIDRISHEVRVYGSIFDQDPSIRSIREPPSMETKIVLMTNYQRLYPGNNRFNYNVMIDEASKSPLHTAFIGLANQLAKDELDGSISIVGDPMQAISLGPYQGSARRMLIMSYLLAPMLNHSSRDLNDRELLAEAKRSAIRGSSFEFLEVTLRMPSPSEEAISKGFYDNDLRAYRSASQILHSNYEANKLRELATEKEQMRKITEKVEELISTGRCILYERVNEKKSYDSNYYRKYGLTYDPTRAELGIETAIALAAGTGKHTTVITTYVDQQIQMDLLMRRKYGYILEKYGIRDQISFSTTQSFLGAEDDNIVAVLGKEYSISTYTQNYSTSTYNEGDPSTIYFNEPEVLNVQLSRHKMLLAIIGNLSILASQAAKQDQSMGLSRFSPLRITADHLLQQSGFEKQGSRYLPKRSSGDAVFMVFDDN